MDRPQQTLDIRKAIYTTNSVESLNRSLRKIIKTRGGFPNEEAALKLLFLALRQSLPERKLGAGHVLVRANGEFGDRIWQDPPAMDSRFSVRMNRNENVGTAPHYDARFAYFPVMAGESLDAIAEFIAWVVERASV